MLEVFLPFRLGDYYLISKRILSISINGYSLVLTVTKVTGTKRTILISKHQLVTKDESLAYEVQIGLALEGLLQNITYDLLKIVISSSQVILKSLQLPFTELEQLKMVIPFEIASTLPFSLQESSIDCIQTSISKEKKESTAIVAVAKQETITLYREIIKNAGAKLDTITLDAFEIAALHTHQKNILSSLHALFCLQKEHVLVMVFEGNVLVGIRSFTPQTKMENEESLDENDDEKKEDRSDTLSVQYFADILFSILPGKKYEKVFITGSELLSSSQLKLLEKTLEIPIVSLSWNTFTALIIDHAPTIEEKYIYSASRLASTCASLCLKQTASFNLAQEESIRTYRHLIIKQLATALIIFFTALLSIILCDALRLSNIHKASSSIEKESVQFVKNNFETQTKNFSTLDKAYKEAERNVIELENTWLPLGGNRQYRFVSCLNTLSEHLTKEPKGLKFEEVLFRRNANQDEIFSLKGQAPDFAHLQKLEDNLRSTRLFTNVPQAQDPHFSYSLQLLPQGEK